MMSVYKHKLGYYCYNFMYKGKRYCKSFKGLSKDEVAHLEVVHKAELVKNGYDITTKKTYYLKDAITVYREYAKAHYTRPDEFNYVVDLFFKIVGNKNLEQVAVTDIEKYINKRVKKVKSNTLSAIGQQEQDLIVFFKKSKNEQDNSKLFAIFLDNVNKTRKYFSDNYYNSDKSLDEQGIITATNVSDSNPNPSKITSPPTNTL